MALSIEQIHLAKELAETMNDTDALMLYHRWVQKFPEHLLRKWQRIILNRTDIENRGKYFTTLVKQHEYRQQHYPRH